MAVAEISEVFNCTAPEFYKIVSDYEKYPEFLSEVKSCKVLKVEGNKKLVEMGISVIKKFTYSIWITENEPHGISWSFASGDLFKTNNGSWKLEEEGGKTRVHYKIDTQFNMFVPGPVTKALVSVNLPNMMSAYAKRIQQIYGGK